MGGPNYDAARLRLEWGLGASGRKVRGDVPSILHNFPLLPPHLRLIIHAQIVLCD